MCTPTDDAKPVVRVAFLKAMEAWPDVKVRVNLPPSIYTEGSRSEIAAEVDAVAALGAGRPNVLLGTGCIPYETDPDNILFLREYAAGCDRFRQE